MSKQLYSYQEVIAMSHELQLVLPFSMDFELHQLDGRIGRGFNLSIKGNWFNSRFTAIDYDTTYGILEMLHGMFKSDDEVL